MKARIIPFLLALLITLLANLLLPGAEETLATAPEMLAAHVPDMGELAGMIP